MMRNPKTPKEDNRETTISQNAGFDDPMSRLQISLILKGYESHDETILGGVVLVLVLSGQADPGTVVGLTGCIPKQEAISNPKP